MCLAHPLLKLREMILISKLFLDNENKLVLQARTQTSSDNENYFTKLIIRKRFVNTAGSTDYEKKDLSSTLNKSARISLTYTAKEIGFGDVFAGLFFVELEDAKGNRVEGFFTEFSAYYNCLLKAVMKLKTIKGCNEIYPDCPDCMSNASTINVYIDALMIALKAGYIKEAEKTLLVLDDICEICRDCEPQKNYKPVEGINLGIKDNHIEPV